MVTDEQMIESLRTVRQYCKECRDCNNCPLMDNCHDDANLEFPSYWVLPKDDDNDGKE